LARFGHWGGNNNVFHKKAVPAKIVFASKKLFFPPDGKKSQSKLFLQLQHKLGLVFTG